MNNLASFLLKLFQTKSSNSKNDQMKKYSVWSFDSTLLMYKYLFHIFWNWDCWLCLQSMNFIIFVTANTQCHILYIFFMWQKKAFICEHVERMTFILYQTVKSIDYFEVNLFLACVCSKYYFITFSQIDTITIKWRLKEREKIMS